MWPSVRTQVVQGVCTEDECSQSDVAHHVALCTSPQMCGYIKDQWTVHTLEGKYQSNHPLIGIIYIYSIKVYTVE